MRLYFLTTGLLLCTLMLSACVEQKQAPIELNGDKFYGFDGATLSQPGMSIYVVKSGDSLSVLAKRYRTSVNNIALANQLNPPYLIKIGQKLQIPTKNSPLNKAQSLAKLDNNTYEAVPVAPISSSTVAPPKKVEKIIIIKKEQQVKAPAPKTNVSPSPVAIFPSTAVKSDTQFFWPLKGPLLLHFGPGKGGYFNDGINISAPENTPILAAADGQVVYAGNELRGYGNLLIIRHKNSWMTAYAHQKDMIVKKGDAVKRGQTIGHVGTTGNVTVPQLHFGIRNGKDALNPEEYLPRR